MARAASPLHPREIHLTSRGAMHSANDVDRPEKPVIRGGGTSPSVDSRRVHYSRGPSEMLRLSSGAVTHANEQRANWNIAGSRGGRRKKRERKKKTAAARRPLLAPASARLIGSVTAHRYAHRSEVTFS